MADTPLRVGIIGGGFGAAAHLPALALQPGVRVVALADSGSGTARSHAREGVEYMSDWRALVSRADLDAVTISVPPAAQRMIVQSALQQGRHVFCEKPFGHDLEDAVAMRQVARVCDRVVGVDYQFRFEPWIEALRAALVAGRIGSLRSADVSWITAGRASADLAWSWRNDEAAGGGVVGAFFSHVADLLRWLTGATAMAATARCSILVPQRKDGQGSLRRVTAEDSMTALLEFDHDFTASCRITNCQPGGGGMRLEFAGDRGVLVMTHRRPFRFEDASLILFPDQGAPETLRFERPGGRGESDSRTHAVSRCMAHFMAAVRGAKERDLPDADDAVAAQHLMQAVRQSSHSGLRVQISDGAA